MATPAPASSSPPVDPRLAAQLALDELFDLSLYQSLRDAARGDLRRMLDELIRVETRHVAFWQEFFGVRLTGLDAGRKVKLRLILAFLSGMNVRRRIVTNLVIIAAAVAIAYAIGLAARALFGISV